MNPLNILVLTAYPPGLGLHGGAQRMYYNLKILAAKHRVTLISFIEHECERELLERLKPLGVEARAVRRLPVPVRHLWIPRPAEHYEFAGAEMAAEVRQVLGSRQVDVIQAEYLQMAQHVPGTASGARSSPSTRCNTPMRPRLSREPATHGPGPGSGTTGWRSSTTRSGPVRASTPWSA